MSHLEASLMAAEGEAKMALEAAAGGKCPALIATPEASRITPEKPRNSATPAFARSSSSKEKAGYVPRGTPPTYLRAGRFKSQAGRRWH